MIDFTEGEPRSMAAVTSKMWATVAGPLRSKNIPLINKKWTNAQWLFRFWPLSCIRPIDFQPNERHEHEFGNANLYGSDDSRFGDR